VNCKYATSFPDQSRSDDNSLSVNSVDNLGRKNQNIPAVDRPT
jgi:hypothetical protein